MKDELFRLLPWRVRARIADGMVLEYPVGARRFRVPASVDMEPWAPSWMSALLSELLSGVDGPFLDIGVNLLQTYFDLRSVDADRMYYGFEPNLACASLAS